MSSINKRMDIKFCILQDKCRGVSIKGGLINSVRHDIDGSNKLIQQMKQARQNRNFHAV
jgi:hypothetical protein